MDEDEVKKYKRAGEIAKRAREYAEKIVKPGAKLLELAEAIEGEIRRLGGEPAFPVNIGVNHIAAHYTPTPDDRSAVPDNSVVKVDIGVHVDGYIADTAATVCLSPALEGLVEASRLALERVVEAVRPGMRAKEIGRIVEEVITKMGYKPIKNLSGHNIDRWKIHGGKSIPNHNDPFATWRLMDGAYAVEPFATNGVGLVEEHSLVTIFALKEEKRGRGAGDFYAKVYGARRTLPFTLRWYKGEADLERGMARLREMGLLIEYPVLVERSSKPVSQFEHTFIVSGKEVIITTL